MKKRLLLVPALILMPLVSWANIGAFQDSDQGTQTITNSSVQTGNTPAPTGQKALQTTQWAVDKTAKTVVAQPTQTLDEVFAALNSGDSDVMARVRYLPNNDDAWYCRWKMLEDAKQTIDCTYYIVDKDIFGQSFLGLLSRKAKEGVKIRLMIDGRIYRSGYMKGMPDMFQELAGFPNVQIKIFNTVTRSLLNIFNDFSGLFASNHDKIIVVDGKLSIVGGRNIGPDYFAANGEYPCVYRDTDVIMEGTHIAQCMTKAFEAEWKCLRNATVKPDWINKKDQKARLQIATYVMERYIRGGQKLNPSQLKGWGKKALEILTELNAEISKFKNISRFGGYQIFTNETQKPVKLVDKLSHIGKVNDITPCLVKFIDACREDIYIQNPYVVLTAEAYQALKRASARGVKILLHSNSGASTDSLFPQAFLMNDWKQMLAEMPTMRILVAPSENERLHSKTFVFDSKITVVGTYNMDPLSQDSNSELIAVINDAEFAKATLDQGQKDMTRVVEYKITVKPDGTVVSVCGPEDHLNAEIIKKMNLYRKLKWIRPVI